MIGKGSKGLADFTFGQVVGLLRETAFLSAVGKVEGKSAAPIENVNLDYICSIRNEAVHKGADFEPAEYDVQYIVSSIKVFLLYFGVAVVDPKLQSAPRTVNELSGILQQMFSSVEIIEGAQPFFKRLTEIISRPEIDTFDLTYLVENPPKRSRAGKDSMSEYFQLAREKVMRGDARVRRILTFNNLPKSAWILFNLVGAHGDVFDTDIRLAFFDAHRHSGQADIMIPNLTMFYSSQDVNDGIAWIYSTQEDDNQNFVGLTGKSFFPTMRRLYASWFRSCEALTEQRAQTLFTELFGLPKTESDIRQIGLKYRDSLSLEDEGFEKAIRFWARVYGVA